VVFVAFLAIIFTFLGGLFAIRFRDKLHLILGFSAGAVIGVAFFDLLPESIELASKTYDMELITLLIATGFIFLMILDRFFSLHVHEKTDCYNDNHKGILSASTLIFHSFLDGVGIGLAFKVSPEVGWVVTAAVLTHDFSDGINTVGVILRNYNNKRKAVTWLALDALAPALGIISTLFFTISESVLGLCLAVFTGFFIYLGASDLIPESHHRHPTIWTTIMTVLGITLLMLVVRLAA
ncbi:MAG: hypothetical protein ACD_58C00276G0001, partial [uncultured bacterium]